MSRIPLFSPLTWPVFSFALAVLIGSLLLALPACQTENASMTFLDALFLATSAVCVTGLSTVDISVQLSFAGQSVLLFLFQLGGLGVTAYTSLFFMLLNRHVPITDRLAVGQALYDQDVHLKTFISQVVCLSLCIQIAAAIGLHVHDPEHFTPFSAFFHAVSAFCNAGFSTFSDNIIGLQADPVVNAILCANIILGGLGFGLLRELVSRAGAVLRGHPRPLSRMTMLILRTNAFLILSGGGLIWLVEHFRPGNDESVGSGLTLGLISFFQAISARTAGFNSVSLPALCEASLLIIILLMLIGGSSGSCAGGIKTGTFRVLMAYIAARLRGERQILLGNRAVPPRLVTAALTLFFLYSMMIGGSMFVLSLTENVFFVPEGRGEISFFRLLFEVVSALGTVGMSLDLTPHLSSPGKLVIILNMFAGRVGFFTLLLAVQSMHAKRQYDFPESSIAIG